MRAASMNPAEGLPQIRKPSHLFRKLVLLFLLTSAYALSLVMLLSKTPWFPEVLYGVFADCTLAVVAGFGVRLLLLRRNWFIRTVTAGVMMVAGMAILGYFSDWKIGIDVIALSLGYVSWTDLAHLVGGITASWAALWAWHRPPRREVASATALEPVRPAPVRQRPRTATQRSWSLNPRLRVGTSSGALSGASHRSSPRRIRAKLVGRTHTRPRRPGSFRLHRPHVQLALVEEHRCPYCLEPVLRTDPRGVKECEICHTLHHADCWEITGTCQVPHQNS